LNVKCVFLCEKIKDFCPSLPIAISAGLR
jgi:hypothetical protein